MFPASIHRSASCLIVVRICYRDVLALRKYLRLRSFHSSQAVSANRESAPRRLDPVHLFLHEFHHVSMVGPTTPDASAPRTARITTLALRMNMKRLYGQLFPVLDHKGSSCLRRRVRAFACGSLSIAVSWQPSKGRSSPSVAPRFSRFACSRAVDVTLREVLCMPSARSSCHPRSSARLSSWSLS